MEAVVGKWKGSAKDTEGADGFLAALGMTHLIAAVKEDHVIEISRNGDTYTTTYSREGMPPQTASVTVGKEEEVTMPYLGKAKAKTTVEDNALVTLCTVDGVTMVSKMYVLNDVLHLEHAVEGNTMKGQATRM